MMTVDRLDIAGVAIDIVRSGGLCDDSISVLEPFAASRRRPAQIVVRIEYRPIRQRVLSGRLVFQAVYPLTRRLDWRLYRMRGSFLYQGFGAGSCDALINGSDFSRIRVYLRAGRQRQSAALGRVVRQVLQVALARYLAAHRLGVVMHAAAIEESPGCSVLYAGVSGSGKSTLCRRFRQKRGGAVIADDRAVVRVVSGRLRVYPTPWGQKEDVPGTEACALGGLICLGRKSARGVLPGSAAVRSLYPSLIAIPWDAGALVWQAGFLRRMAASAGVRLLCLREAMSSYKTLGKKLR